MSKKIMKRSLALGALMAFVITGGAWAAETTIQPGTYNVIYNSHGQLACPAIWKEDVLLEYYTMYGNYMGNNKDEAYSVVNIGDGVEILSAQTAVMNVAGGGNHSTVNMTGGLVVGDIYGGLNGEGNTVNISGGKVSYTSYVNGSGQTVELGGHIHVTNGGEGTAGGNINISGTADLTDATLYGVKPYYSNGTINFMDGWTGTVRVVDTNDVVNITEGADVTIGDIRSANTTINLDNATWSIADDTNVIAKLTGENGVIKVDVSVLDTAGAVQIGANESTGTVLKTGVTDVDLSGGAKAALENALTDDIKNKLDAAVVTTAGDENFEYAVYAQKAALYGDVDIVDGKVVTEMDTDVLVARDDVKAGSVSLKDTAAQVDTNTADIAANKADIAANKAAIEANTAGVAQNAQAIADNTAAIAKKVDNNATGQNAIAMGFGAKATANDSAALGYGADAGNYAATAIGKNAAATGSSATAIGEGATATASWSNAIGKGAVANGESGNAIGTNANASASDSTAIGTDAKASATYATAVGHEANAAGHAAVAIGDKVTAGYLDTAIGQEASAQAGGQGGAIAIGYKASADYISSTAVGREAKVSDEYSSAYGANSEANGYRSTAVGYKAVATNDGDVAIGAHSITTTAVSVDSVSVGGNTYTFAGNNTDGYVAAASVGGGESGSLTGGKTLYRQIQNVAAGQVNADSTDAVNGSQLYAAYQAIDAAQSSTSAAISGINQRLDRTNTKINKVGAGAAALAALHPLDYDPDDKLTFSAGMGNYAGENAAALGAFYRPDEKFMISVGGSMGNGENMVNLGLSIGLDKPNGLAKLSKKELIQKVNAVEAENDALEDRVAKLEALVAQLASK